jgi:hypothetical protein
MIEIICWSKDRACQLDLTLSTFKKYFKEWNDQTVNIIYTYTNDFYKQGYDLVKQYHPEFNWILETNLRFDTLNIINSTKNKYISFFVDDDCFVDYFSLTDPQYVEFFNNPNVTCVSPRMAPYINFCYTQNQPQPPPIYNDKLMWEWKTAIHDHGYPWSVANFHVFRIENILPINRYGWRAPNSLEGAMCNLPLQGEYMICYPHAKAITASNNRCQTENPNRHDNLNTLDDLNFQFLNNKRLSTETNHQYKLNMAHGPLKYEWRN